MIIHVLVCTSCNLTEAVLQRRPERLRALRRTLAAAAVLVRKSKHETGDQVIKHNYHDTSHLNANERLFGYGFRDWRLPPPTTTSQSHSKGIEPQFINVGVAKSSSLWSSHRLSSHLTNTPEFGELLPTTSVTGSLTILTILFCCCWRHSLLKNTLEYFVLTGECVLTPVTHCHIPSRLRFPP